MLETRSIRHDAVGPYLERRSALTSLLDDREAAGLVLSRKLTSLADGLLGELYQGALSRLPKRPNAPVGVFAVGSYGRRQLGLQSDLDVLFATSGSTSEIGSLVEGVLYPLWDAGVTIGHQVMRVDDLFQNAAEALPTATALLDLRLVAGSDALATQLQERAVAELFSGAGLRGFVERMEREVSERWRRFGDSVYLLEPDVKNGAGGLRDVSMVWWTARAARQGVSVSEVVREGGMSAREAQSLAEATEFFYRVRNHLHHAAKRRNDRLTFDQQEHVAMRMGYNLLLPMQGATPEELIGPTVEAFMSDYYQHARAVTRAQEQVLARVHERLEPGTGKTYVLRDGIISHVGQVGIARQEDLVDKPVLALELYALAVTRGEPVMPATRDMISRLAAEDPGFGPTLRRDPTAAALFTQLLCTSRQVPFRNDSILGELHSVGLLLAMIPEFAPVVGRVHHDLYHVYTVDVHSIAAVDRIRALIRGELMQRHALACRLAAELFRPQRLFFAALLHDIGKVFGGKEHSIRGAAMARAILARFGLDAPDIEHVSKLILHHLTMYFVAARRDLADPNTIAQFADQVGDQDCLCNLYLLTIADISTTAPTSMTSWKSRMLDELYTHTNEQLRGDVCDPLQRARSAIVAHLADEVEPARLEAFLRTMPNRYVLSNTPPEISAHIKALEGAQGKRVHLQLVPSRHEGVGELCVVTGLVPDDQRVGDRPGLLASIAAALTSNRLEIFAAQIYTRLQEAGREEVLDVFWVRDRLHGTAGLVETLPKVEQNLEQLLSGQVTPQELLQKVAPTRWSDRPSPPVPTEVAVDNRSSDTHTIIEVIAQDRPGVLFGLAHTLHQLGLDIAFAKVNTEGNRVVDIFYVTELDETKVATRERMLQIKSQLSAAMHRDLTHSA